MSRTTDDQLGRLLREDAPPVRDPLFRIGLVERRERQRYRQRLRKRVLIAALLAVLPGVALLLAARSVGTAVLLVIAVGMVGAAARVISETRPALRWLRVVRRAQKLL